MAEKIWQELAGRSALCRAMKRQRVTQAALAKRLGLAEITVKKWCNGERRPSVALWPTLKRILGVEEALWMTAAEKARESRLSAA